MRLPSSGGRAHHSLRPRVRGDAERRSDGDIAVSCSSADRRTWLDISRTAEEANTLLKIGLARLEDATPELRRRVELEGGASMSVAKAELSVANLRRGLDNRAETEARLR